MSTCPLFRYFIFTFSTISIIISIIFKLLNENTDNEELYTISKPQNNLYVEAATASFHSGKEKQWDMPWRKGNSLLIPKPNDSQLPARKGVQTELWWNIMPWKTVIQIGQDKVGMVSPFVFPWILSFPFWHIQHSS